MIGSTPGERAEGSRAAHGAMTRRRLAVALGWVWVIDAVLQAEPPNFARSYPLGQLAQSVMGAPPWEHRAIYDLIGPFVTHWPLWNLAAVVVQAAIGVALVSGSAPRVALAASLAWAPVVWLVGEGLGGMPTGFGMLLFGAPGPVLLYAVLAVLAWPGTGSRPVSSGAWRTTWGALWAGGALLQIPWVYPTGEMFRANFEEAALGQPAWATAVSGDVERVVLAAPVLWSALLATFAVAVAVGGVVHSRYRRVWLAVAIGFSAVAWVVAQLFGGVLTWGATDIGTAPLVVLLALAGWSVHVPAIHSSRRTGSTGGRATLARCLDTSPPLGA